MILLCNVWFVTGTRIVDRCKKLITKTQLFLLELSVSMAFAIGKNKSGKMKRFLCHLSVNFTCPCYDTCNALSGTHSVERNEALWRGNGRTRFTSIKPIFLLIIQRRSRRTACGHAEPYTNPAALCPLQLAVPGWWSQTSVAAWQTTASAWGCLSPARMWIGVATAVLWHLR